MSRGLGAFWGAALALVAVTPSAAAEAPAPPYPPQLPRFPIVLESDRPDAIYDLSYANAPGPPFVRCVGGCTLYGFPANYRLTVSGPGFIQSERSFVVTEPSRVFVKPRTEKGRNVGLGLGLTGLGLIAAGVLLMAQYQPSSDPDPSAREHDPGNDPAILLLGLGVAAAGVTLTSVGFVRFGQRAPAVSVEPF